MKIIDFARKGNVVRFYLGEKDPEWGWTNKDYRRNGETPDWLKPSDEYYGDDWNDAPYQHNAGHVYPWFVKGYKDVSFDFDDLVFEPADGDWRAEYSKDDMVARKLPCLVVVDSADYDHDGWDGAMLDYDSALKTENAEKYWFGDDMEPDEVPDKPSEGAMKVSWYDRDGDKWETGLMKCRCRVCGEEADVMATAQKGDQMRYVCPSCSHAGAVSVRDAYLVVE